MTQKIVLDIQGILDHLPHRPPFLLVDRVIEAELNKSLVAIKNVTINEPFFVGHFPGHPVMPGVLMLEALAQASAILAFMSRAECSAKDGFLYYLAGIDKARFKRVVVPGDQLRLEVEVIKSRQSMWKLQGIAKVDDQIACTAELMSISKES